MKALSILLLSLLVAILPGVGLALEIPENYTNSITALDFYPGGARFTFTVDPYDQDGNFKFTLPGSFNSDSIQLLNPEELYGDIHVEKFSRTRWTPSRLEALKNECDRQAQEIAKLNAKKSSLSQTLSMLEEFRPEKSTPDELLNYIKNTQALRLETETELADLNKKISDEQEKLKMLNDELNSKRPRGENIFLVITGRTAGKAEISAFTSAASWSPRHVLNLDSDSGNVTASMYVTLSQKTGLDYTGDIVLHTKNPGENITTPSLDPLRVAIKPKEQPIAKVGTASYSRANKAMRAAPEMQLDMMAEAPMLIEEAIEENKGPAVKETLSDRVIEIEGFVPGDGTEKEFETEISENLLKAQLILTLIPEKRNNAWIIASMDKGNEKLIPAPATLRVDGYESGKIFIGEYETQKSIPFGYAEQITIKKEALVEKTGVSWFSGVFAGGYKLEITNGSSTEKIITVKDRLPIPTDEKIKLDVKKIDPKEKERDRENRLTWEITVPGGQTVPIIVDYSLSYPSGEELQYK